MDPEKPSGISVRFHGEIDAPKHGSESYVAVVLCGEVVCSGFAFSLEVNHEGMHA
jgi:hypothetical protein